MNENLEITHGISLDTQNDIFHPFYIDITIITVGSQASFRRVYEDPILASRQPGMNEEVQTLGKERATELKRITSMFILRRTSDINNKYLPPKGSCKLSRYSLFRYQAFF